MRAFLIFLVIAGLGGLYLWQKQNDQTATPSNANKPVATASQPVSTSQPTPAPPGVASEHNWMKRSLDRARDVTQKSRDQTKQGQDP